MEELNNSDSLIYIDTLKKQKKYITLRLSKIKNKYLEDTMGCCSTKEDIAKHLNNGPAQNLIQTFFKLKIDKCILCNKKKGTNGIRQLERAHCNKYSRYYLLIMALNDLYIDSSTPLKVGIILKKFIEKHELCPIYILCNLCHNKYDN